MKQAVVAAIVQARMGSTRLPGKVLMPLAGREVLWHIVHRLKKCQTVDHIILATSTSEVDDPIEVFGQRNGVMVVRGSEENVLQRYDLAAKQVDAQVIVRITGDAPLIEPQVIDQLVTLLIEEDADYAYSDSGFETIYEGFVPFSRRALEKIVAEAGDHPLAREHVSSYIPHYPDGFKIVVAPDNPAHRIEGVRLSVDTPADLRFLETIYQRLKASPGDLDCAEMVSLLRQEPALLEINRHVQQKTAHQQTFRVLIRCDGDSRIGLGHVVRCLALAEELRDRHGLGVSFAMLSGEIGEQRVREAGFPIEGKPEELVEDDWVYRLVEHKSIDLLIVDVRTELNAETLNLCRELGCLCLVIDDGSPRRLAADLVVYPPVPQLQRMQWDGFGGERLCGWEWILLRKSFCRLSSPAQTGKPRVLITMGGSDPAGLTLLTLEALEQCRILFDTDVVIGPGFKRHDALELFLGSAKRDYQIHRQVADLAPFMVNASLAVVAFGVTAYELCAARVPALLLCLSADHAESAMALDRAGAAISLGEYGQVTSGFIAEMVDGLLADPDRRQQMQSFAGELIDGRGVERLASRLETLLEEKHG